MKEIKFRNLKVINRSSILINKKSIKNAFLSIYIKDR